MNFFSKIILSLSLLLMPFFSFSQSTILDTILHGGIQRNYILYVPQIYSASQSVPLLLNLHGYTSNAGQQMIYGDFRPIADTANFLIVHPNGTKDNSSQQFWNVGFSPSSIDDVGFLEALIDTLSSQYNINSNQVFSTGMSNGGFMSYELACQSNKIAAIASVTGSMTSLNFNSCNPYAPIPVMQIHGTADATVPYNGGPTYKNIDSLVAYWVDFNNCNKQPIKTNIPDRNSSDLTTTEHFLYEDGDSNTSVEFFKVNGGGHTWPGSAITIIGVTSQDFSASAEIWRFFSKGEAVKYPLTSSVQERSNSFKIYPNPAEDFIKIESSLNTESQLVLYDILGNEKYRSSFTGNTSIAVSELPSGTYFVLIKNNKQQFYKKLLVR